MIKKIITSVAIITIACTAFLISCGNHRQTYPANTNSQDDPKQEPTLVLVGQPTTGSIDAAGDTGWFSVELSEGVEYCFKTFGLSAGMDTILRVVDIDQSTVLAENDNVSDGDLSSEVCITILSAGTFYVVVVHKDPAVSSGTYGLIVEQTVPPDGGDDDDDECDKHGIPGHGHGHCDKH